MKCVSVDFSDLDTSDRLPASGWGIGIPRRNWQPVSDETGSGATIAALLEPMRRAADAYEDGVRFAHEYLAGSCTGAIEDSGREDDSAFLSGIDDTVFKCEDCDWWCLKEEASQLRDDVCSDCGEIDP